MSHGNTKAGTGRRSWTSEAHLPRSVEEGMTEHTGVMITELPVFEAPHFQKHGKRTTTMLLEGCALRVGSEASRKFFQPDGKRDLCCVLCHTNQTAPPEGFKWEDYPDLKEPKHLLFMNASTHLAAHSSSKAAFEALLARGDKIQTAPSRVRSSLTQTQPADHTKCTQAQMTLLEGSAHFLATRHCKTVWHQINVAHTKALLAKGTPVELLQNSYGVFNGARKTAQGSRSAKQPAKGVALPKLTRLKASERYINTERRDEVTSGNGMVYDCASFAEAVQSAGTQGAHVLLDRLVVHSARQQLPSTSHGQPTAHDEPDRALVSSMLTEAQLQHCITAAPMPIILPSYFNRLTTRNSYMVAKFAGETVEQLEGPRFAAALRTVAQLFDGRAEEHDDDKDVTEILAVGASLLRVLAECAFMPQLCRRRAFMPQYDELRDDVLRHTRL